MLPTLACPSQPISCLKHFSHWTFSQSCSRPPALSFFPRQDTMFRRRKGANKYVRNGKTLKTEIINWQMSLVGTIFQAVTFLSFTIILLNFGLRVSSWYPDKWRASSLPSSVNIPYAKLFPPWNTAPILNWRILYFTDVLTCIPYLARSGYRIAEFWKYHNQPFRDNEVELYEFDALPLFIGVLLYVFVWPPRFMKFPQNFRNTGYDESTQRGF